MATIFIFHGTGGRPDGNWFPWLKAECETRHHTVIIPAFPNAEHPNLGAWMRKLESEFPMNEDTILVGHSIGATLILRILESRNTPVLGSFLVAPVLEPMGNDFDPLISTFVDHPFNWKAIQKNAGAMTIFHGDDDPYVPLSQARSIADRTGASLKVIVGGKHLNRGAGFSSFPLLRDSILPILS